MRTLTNEHLKEAGRLIEQARLAEDPDVVLGLVQRAETRLRNARINAAIDAETRDAEATQSASEGAVA